MRTLSPPLRVTLPPPSITVSGLSLNILAVRFNVMVAGSDPQAKVITPPCATAATKASPVQLAALPLPTTVVGLDTSSGWASEGIAQFPVGVAGRGRRGWDGHGIIGAHSAGGVARGAAGLPRLAAAP